MKQYIIPSNKTKSIPWRFNQITGTSLVSHDASSCASASEPLMVLVRDAWRQGAGLDGWMVTMCSLGFCMVLPWGVKSPRGRAWWLFPQIAGSYRGSNFSKGGIVLANWPTSGCCSECCAGCCQGCCCGCCPGCSGSCFPLGGVRVLSRVLCRGAVQGAPDHVCHWVVSGCCAGCCPGCCSGCSGSCLPLGGVRVLCRVLSRVLFRVLRIMFAIGRCQGAVQGAVRVLRIMFAIGRCQGAVQGAVQGGVQGCCWGCSGSCLSLAVSGSCPGCCPGCSGRCQGAVHVAVQGAPDHACHWAVSQCCWGCCPGVLLRGAVQGAPDHVCHGAGQGAVQRCCPGCSGSRLLLGGVRVLSKVLSRVLRIMFAIGRCQGAAPDHVCHWVVSTCCPACCPRCSGSCLPLGGVRVLCRVLSRVLFRVLRIMFAIGRCQGAVQGGVQHAIGVSGCCPGCSGSCLPLGGVRVLSMQGAVQGAVQGAPDHVCHWAVSGCCPACCQGAPDHVCHWAVSGWGAVQGVQGAPDHVSGCCPGCCARDKGSKAEPEFNVLLSIWGLCWCNFFWILVFCPWFPSASRCLARWCLLRDVAWDLLLNDARELEVAEDLYRLEGWCWSLLCLDWGNKRGGTHGNLCKL